MKPDEEIVALNYAIDRLEAKCRRTDSQEKRAAIIKVLETLRAMRKVIADEQRQKLI